MILNIFKRNSTLENQKKIIITIIKNLNIKDSQKETYLNSLDFLDETGLNNLYKSLQSFIGEIETKNLEDIKIKGFSEIAGMRKKEAIEKQKEINNFGFLLNNL
ncbi:hypothetical protein H3C61_02860 [Candidatus Gracilibacteria bacterium]|nr:hypothetical protein [Candidatus Gracilibacteria bacterium]